MRNNVMNFKGEEVQQPADHELYLEYKEYMLRDSTRVVNGDESEQRLRAIRESIRADDTLSQETECHMIGREREQAVGGNAKGEVPKPAPTKKQGSAASPEREIGTPNSGNTFDGAPACRVGNRINMTHSLRWSDGTCKECGWKYTKLLHL